MLLKIKGYELEILQGKFVCLGQNDVETSHSSEWKCLDPRLQEEFQAIREELVEVMEKWFIRQTSTCKTRKDIICLL
jgi:hypothetical protein